MQFHVDTNKVLTETSPTVEWHTVSERASLFRDRQQLMVSIEAHIDLYHVQMVCLLCIPIMSYISCQKRLVIAGASVS